jgi:hypothetical protein
MNGAGDDHDGDGIDPLGILQDAISRISAKIRRVPPGGCSTVA